MNIVLWSASRPRILVSRTQNPNDDRVRLNVVLNNGTHASLGLPGADFFYDGAGQVGCFAQNRLQHLFRQKSRRFPAADRPIVVEWHRRSRAAALLQLSGAPGATLDRGRRPVGASAGADRQPRTVEVRSRGGHSCLHLREPDYRIPVADMGSVEEANGRGRDRRAIWRKVSLPPRDTGLGWVPRTSPRRARAVD